MQEYEAIHGNAKRKRTLTIDKSDSEMCYLQDLAQKFRKDSQFQEENLKEKCFRME